MWRQREVGTVVSLSTVTPSRRCFLELSPPAAVLQAMTCCVAGYDMSPDEGQEELEEVQADLRKKDEEVGTVSPVTRRAVEVTHVEFSLLLHSV